MKNGDLSIVFSVQGTGGSPTEPDVENRVGDQDTGSPGRPVSSGFQRILLGHGELLCRHSIYCCFVSGS